MIYFYNHNNIDFWKYTELQAYIQVWLKYQLPRYNTNTIQIDDCSQLYAVGATDAQLETLRELLLPEVKYFMTRVISIDYQSQ